MGQFIFIVGFVLLLVLYAWSSNDVGLEKTRVHGWNDAALIYKTTGIVPPDMPKEDHSDWRESHQKAYIEGWKQAIEKIKERESEKQKEGKNNESN